MKDLAVRLAALDPDAGAALRVIAYFDRLVEERAGLRAIVRGAAVLAGCPARLRDDERHVSVRVEPDGSSTTAGEAPDEAWMSAPIDAAATLTLERPGTPGEIEAMVLERAAAAARTVLDRTRGHASRTDPASAELVVDREAPESLRLRAAARLGFQPTDCVRAVALDNGTPRLLHAESAPDVAGRAGIGPAVTVKDLPDSWDAARIALRFTAEGDERDPGRRIVHADQLGGLVLLASAILPGAEPHPDLRALERAAAAAPWMLSTLDAVAEAASLRAAASALRVHHSTLQDRLAHSHPLLGWDPRDPQGRLRLQVALAMRRLHRNPPL
ncbi:helix-turn-helix domain-containing protein [Paractinoplanes atraurantiacus]|uniref:PucR C-terminal helix-turn-helix domain-containing protein n=1 Tax=Paractinoplanes atraurantiacus TaxID=1036182 RepID=A0A285JRL8_9ACTN|nr:helix-turn-helix domain-containing protein [Actinoplanes atraurantiacus]SNY62898.1 PucR C-terminal helix-turn-helix domain-containing protein [Actinoplanes atraurantiacus]